jgi:DNA-binding phage protein
MSAHGGIAQIAKETGLTRQTVYRIKGDPAGAEGALAAWGIVRSVKAAGLLLPRPIPGTFAAGQFEDCQ